MPPKPELPSVVDEIALTQRQRPNLAGLRPRDDLPDSTVEANSRSMGSHWGASTRLPEPEEETPLSSVRLDLPEYVDKQLKLKIAESGGTKAHYILKALARDGWEVHEKDLKLDRRKRGQK